MKILNVCPVHFCVMNELEICVAGWYYHTDGVRIYASGVMILVTCTSDGLSWIHCPTRDLTYYLQVYMYMQPHSSNFNILSSVKYLALLS